MSNRQAGVAGIFVLLFILLLLMGGFIGLDLGYIFYTTHCDNTDIVKCLTTPASPAPTPDPETSVSATGNISVKGYGVTLTMNVPLNGGNISGSFDGDCQGVISGTFDGNDNGSIKGTARGSCNPFMVPIPSSATFTGTVNKQSKVIPISGTGSAAGFSGSGSLTLTY